MLSNVKTALLLTNIDSFASNIRSIAEECDVALTVEEDWSEKYRVSEEVILCGSKYLDKINVLAKKNQRVAMYGALLEHKILEL